MKMDYKFVNIENDGGKKAIRITTKFSQHRDIIEEHAKFGYRYTGYIPTEQTGHGLIVSMDLIFVKD